MTSRTIDLFYPAILTNFHITRRESLDQWYFPDNGVEHSRRDEMNARRQWSEGWVCNFINRGLALAVLTVRTADQLHMANAYRAEHGLGPIDSKSEKDFRLRLESDVSFFFDSKLTEPVRKAINISARWRERADQITAFQFHLDENSVFGIKFNRERTDQDDRIVSEIFTDLSKLGLI